MKRTAPRGADRTNYRRTLNRAYLVLSLIWIFAGLIYPLYRADQARALEGAQLNACIHAADGKDLARQACNQLDGSVRVAHDAIHAFEATYGEVRDWPISIFLVCLLPPALVYVSIRFVLLGVLRLFSLPKRVSKPA